MFCAVASAWMFLGMFNDVENFVIVDYSVSQIVNVFAIILAVYFEHEQEFTRNKTVYCRAQVFYRNIIVTIKNIEF